jgi:hypothetical protein
LCKAFWWFSVGVSSPLFHDPRRTAARNLRRAGIAFDLAIEADLILDLAVLDWTVVSFRRKSYPDRDTPPTDAVGSEVFGAKKPAGYGAKDPCDTEDWAALAPLNYLQLYHFGRG